MSVIHPNADPQNSRAVSSIERYKDRVSLLCTLTADTSLTIEELLNAASTGESILSTDAGVKVLSDGTVNYNPAGAASAANGFLPNEYEIHGGKTIVDTAELYAVGGLATLTLIVFEPNL